MANGMENKGGEVFAQLYRDLVRSHLKHYVLLVASKGDDRGSKEKINSVDF